MYYAMVRAFERQTGLGAVLNTSFNVAGEPMVSTPSEAVRDFYATGMDMLVLGPYLLRKGTSS